MSDEPSAFRPDLLAGKRLLITGGGSGMGKAIAVLAARLGAEVAICGRDSAKLEHVRDLIQEVTGRDIMAVPTNIRDPEAVEDIITATVFAALEAKMSARQAAQA